MRPFYYICYRNRYQRVELTTMGHPREFIFCKQNLQATFYFLLCSLSVCVSLSSHAEQKRFILDGSKSGKDLGDYVYYFADAQGTQTVEDITQNTNLFAPLSKRRFAFNVHTHWYKIKLRNPGDLAQSWFFSTGISTSPLMRSYWVTESEIKTLVSVTDTSSFYDRAEQNSSIIIPITLQPGESGDLYVENRSIANYPLRLKPYSEPAFQERLINYTLINGIILGAVFIFFMFFFIQYLTQPSRMLAIYCLYIFSTLIFFSHVLGFNFRYLWPNQGHFNSLFTSVIGSITYVWYFLFSSELFELRKNNKGLHKAILVWASIAMAMAFLGFFTDTAYPMSIVALFGLPFPVLVGIWAVKQKMPSAYYFLTGSAIHCGLAYLLVIVALGIDFGPTDYLFNIVSGGQIVDLCLISAAIAYQTKKLREQLNNHLEQRIEDMEALVKTEKEKSQFLSQSERYILNLATTTHDIAQPLASIRLALATLDDEKSKAVKDQIENTLKYTNQLIRSVLKDSQTDFNDLRKQISVEDLVKDVSARHRDFFLDKDLRFKTYSQDVVAVCYPVMIQRILDNLISNALRYTFKGGVLISARRRGNCLLVQIWDTGKGMPRHQVNNLMAPFKQLNQEQLEKEGFGLGLYIVKTLCSKLEYTLTVRSVEGQGTCISVFIPDAVQCLVE